MVFSLLSYDFNIKQRTEIEGVELNKKRIQLPLLRRKFAKRNADLGQIQSIFNQK